MNNKDFNEQLLNNAWATYCNARLQLIERAVASGKTDAEITEVFYSESAKNQVDSTIVTVRSYMK